MSITTDTEPREVPDRLVSSPDKAEQIAEVLKAVAHPIRLRIIAILAEEELHVSALAKRLGVGQAIVSQQLRILRMKKLVSATRTNGYARYRLIEPRLRDLVGCMEHCSTR
ncbi:MAG: ArsR/SmtB family transcription factor [Myxococcota bacterium]